MQREREAETQAKQKEKQAPCREPDVGLDPGSPGSRPRLQETTTPLGLPISFHF